VGKTPPPKRLGGGLRALKFEFFTNAEKDSMLVPKMRQARTCPPQGANHAVPMIQFSRFSVRRSRPARSDCSDYSFMCVSPASHPDRYPRPAASHLLSNATVWKNRSWFHPAFLPRRRYQMRRKFSVCEKTALLPLAKFIACVTLFAGGVFYAHQES